MKRFLLAAAVVVCAWSSVSEADAQWGWQGYPQFYGRNVYSVYDQDRLPYFALHPPVYYSRPVPRTYGYSPFAYPGFYRTPEINVAEAEVVVNPYFDTEPQPAPAGEVAPAPTPAAPQALPPLRKSNVPTQKPAAKKPGADKSAAKTHTVKPLRITNPYAGEYFTTSGK